MDIFPLFYQDIGICEWTARFEKKTFDKNIIS